MKKTNKKGFTLAELLVVVAIIAVLVAIAIPIFTSQLEKSREAVDAANIRAAYAEVMTDAVTGDTTNKYTRTVDIKQKKADWQTTIDWPKDIADTAKGDVTVGGIATITFKPAATGETGGTVEVKYSARPATSSES